LGAQSIWAVLSSLVPALITGAARLPFSSPCLDSFALGIPLAQAEGSGFLIFLGSRMATGTVKWFNEAKGYGFITPDDGGQDLFAHFSEIQAKGFKTLQEKQKVSFEVKTGPKGKQAAQIKPI
jgi:cold shock CspA family protein